jgi:hypothetical protein
MQNCESQEKSPVKTWQTIENNIKQALSTLRYSDFGLLVKVKYVRNACCFLE